MICTIHNKLNACCYLAELAGNQFIAIPLIMVCYMTFKVGIGYI